MTRQKTYSLWLRPFGDLAFKLQQRIEKLSKKHDTPRFEPHVTLLGGLQAGETELIHLTDTLASSLHPFDLVLTRAGCRDAYYQSLFVHVEKDDALLKTQKMAERLFDSHSDEAYMPHLSLLYGDLSREEKERILNVMGREFHIRFTAHNLLLVDTTGQPENWKNIHSSEFDSV